MLRFSTENSPEMRRGEKHLAIRGYPTTTGIGLL